MKSDTRTGPLAGTRIVEFAGVGPGPFCAMLLADMGAEIITLDRTVPSGLGIKKEARFNPMTRNRASVALDLKAPAGRAVALRLVGAADALIEGFRPGVMERLGLAPEDCWKENPRLVFGRMTGWGQDGPLAESVGHDLNYLAISGVLSLLGSREGGPAIPLNLLGDFAGGGLYLALGVVSAMFEAKNSGKGQVVDANMMDGIASLMTHLYGFFASGRWVYQREANFLDGGAPWYNVYQTKDGKYVSVAPIERKFYDELLRAMGLDPQRVPDQLDRESWPDLRRQFTEIFKGRTRDEWCAIMEGREACFAPVLEMPEAIEHPHARARKGYVEVAGVVQPGPAPRFSRTPSSIRRDPPEPGADTVEVLHGWGFADAEIAELRAGGVINQA